MKKILSFVAVLAMVSMLAACGGGSDVGLDSLNGEWTIDVDATLELAGEQNEAAALMLKEMFKHMSFKFDTKAKTITMSAAGHSETQPFEVVSEKDGAFVFKVDSHTVNAKLEKKGGKDMLTMAQGTDKFVLIKK